MVIHKHVIKHELVTNKKKYIYIYISFNLICLGVSFFGHFCSELA